MKKKVIIISFVSIVAILFIYFLIIILQPDEIKKDNIKRADEYSKIEYFLDLKRDNWHLNYGCQNQFKGLDYDDFIFDEDDKLYDIMKKIEYKEINKRNKDSEYLYEVFVASKDEDNKIKKISISAYVYIYTNNTICTSIFVGESFSMVSKTRTYLLNDEDYEKLTNELNNFYKNLEVQND